MQRSCIIEPHLNLQSLSHSQQRDHARAVLGGAHYLRVDVRVECATVRLHDSIRLQISA